MQSHFKSLSICPFPLMAKESAGWSQGFDWVSKNDHQDRGQVFDDIAGMFGSGAGSKHWVYVFGRTKDSFPTAGVCDWLGPRIQPTWPAWVGVVDWSQEGGLHGWERWVIIQETEQMNLTQVYHRKREQQYKKGKDKPCGIGLLLRNINVKTWFWTDRFKFLCMCVLIYLYAYMYFLILLRGSGSSDIQW